MLRESEKNPGNLRMFLRWFVVVTLMYSIVGCVIFRPNTPQAYPKVQAPKSTTQIRHLPAFSQVRIKGPFDVRLSTDKNRPASVKLDGSRGDLAHVRTDVKQGTLYVYIGSSKKHIGKPRSNLGHVTVTLNVPHLHLLAYQGSGHIEGHHIQTTELNLSLENAKQVTLDGRIGLNHLTVIGAGAVHISGIRSQALQIKLKGSPQVTLKGQANVRCIEMTGNANLRLYWVNSMELIVRIGGASRLTLSGTVHRLDSVASNQSHFDGRYLRVKEAFVKTNDEAISDISVTKHQHALARDKSDIYYYQSPSYQMGFMARNGSILDMHPTELEK